MSLARVTLWVVASLFLSAAAFWLWVSPTAPRLFGWRATEVACKTLGAPVSAANLVAPSFLRSAGARQFQPGVMEPGPWLEELARYLGLGAVAYLPLIALVHSGIRIFRRSTRGASAPS